MLNKILRIALGSRPAVLLLSALIFAAGLIVLMRTEVDIFPDLNAPTVVVMTEAPGYAPEEVETVVTYPIETAVNGATGVRRVRSASNTGFSVVWVEFDWNTDIYRARQIVTERLEAIGDELPDNVKRPTLGPQSSILGEMFIIGLTADSTSLLRLRTIADKTIKPRLLALGGVSQVSVIGGDEREYQIKLNPRAMRQLQVTMDEVIEATEGLNDNASGGVVYDYANEYIIKADLNTTDTERICDAVVRSDERGTITLADIATVSVGGKQPRIGVASVETHPAVIMTVTKQSDAGTISLTERIDRELEMLRPGLPTDVHIATDIFRQSDFIDNSISNLQRALLEGAFFVIVVLFFFLMNLRTTLISIVALPVSIIISVLVLNMLGYTINTMSLGGIAIAIGSLVDDAIVDVENVYKRLRQNRELPDGERKSTLEVVYHASAEVRLPIFNSSLIIIASFVPLFFLSGIEGRLLKPLGIAFIVALCASTAVALTLTPVLCSYLLGSDKALRHEQDKLSHEPSPARALKRLYGRALNFSLAHGRAMLIATGVALAVALGLFFTLGRSFLPGFNEGSFTINVSTLPGISLDESDRIGRLAEEIILSVPEINTVARKTGRAELDEHSLGVNVSEIEAPYTLRDRSRGRVARELRQKLSELPGVNVEIGQPISHRIDAMLSGSESQIALKLYGDDLNRLFALGARIRQAAQSVPGIVDVNLEQQMERPELQIKPRRKMLQQYGITLPELRRTVEVALAGRVVSQVYEDRQPYDLTLMVDPELRNSLDEISQITIDSKFGPVPLDAVAEIVSSTGPNTINRENVKRRLIISANVEGRDLRGAVEDLRHSIEQSVQLPENYYLTYSGQFENEAAASRTLMWASLGALLIILMLLYGEYKNFTQALVILLNMPLAMIGGVLILVITGAELNIPAIIGFIALMGISTRNGMLLMSRFNRLAEQGVPIDERVRVGSTDRLLPIVMTALTSALALIPLAINGDKPGNELQSPMAVVILGGLLTSTLLNLLIVPIIYKLINKRHE